MAFVQSALMATYIALVCYGAWSDARTLRIPNSVSLALLVAFIPMALVAGIGLEAAAWHLGVGVVVLVIGFVLFAFGLFGGGDAKLMAAAALWVGWNQVLFFIFAVVLTGGVLSVLVVLLRKGLGLWPDWLVRSAEGLFTPNKAVPYGVAIAVGAMFTVPRMDVLPESWNFLARFILG
ncbi:MAG: prepilin peptidase [Rhodospirillales bacterium]|nr:prepilin peptidase [Rhodospirillales bacterium]